MNPLITYFYTFLSSQNALNDFIKSFRESDTEFENVYDFLQSHQPYEWISKYTELFQDILDSKERWKYLNRMWKCCLDNYREQVNLNKIHTTSGIDEDDVINPKHYKNRNPEPIDVIVAWNLDYLEGNVLKYLARYKYKNGIEDLLKARTYLDFLIEREKKKLEENQVQE